MAGSNNPQPPADSGRGLGVSPGGSALDRVIDALTECGTTPRKSGSGWIARCPAHDDTNPSLSISNGDGRVLLHCHAGCHPEDITGAAKLTMADLFDEQRSGRRNDDTWTPRGPAVAVYDYTDEHGQLLFQVCRTADKQFPQRRPDRSTKSGWSWRLGDVRRVLYQLPIIIAAVGDGETIYLTEGEKDAHALGGHGAIATCNPGGAGKWRKEYASVLRGASVVIVRDRDQAGHDHAVSVAKSLTGIAAGVRVVEAREGKDAADHLAAGHTIEQFVDVTEDVITQQTADDEEEPEPPRYRPGRLPDEFWAARPLLRHVRQAAWSRGRSAEAVLGVALARLAADTHHIVKLPAAVGAVCGLSMIVAPIGLPGQGKSSGEDIACELIPARLIDPVCDQVSPGSRQGLAELLFDIEDEPDPNNPKKTIKVKRQSRSNAFVTVDEGEVLLNAQRGRPDPNSISPDLKTIFSDRTWGQANASTERKRVVPGGSYAFGVVVILQPEKAGPLLAEAGSGLPQRVLFCSADTPVPAPLERPEWPGPIWRPKMSPIHADANGRLLLDIHLDIESQVKDDDYYKHDHGGDPLDVHRNLIRLKVAAVLSVADGRNDVNLDDWALAGQILDASDQVRSSVQAALEREQREIEHARQERKAHEAVVADKAIEQRRVLDTAKRIAMKVRAEPAGTWTRNSLRKDALSRAQREVYDEALDHAKAQGWVVERVEPGQRGGERRVVNPGRVKP